MGVSVGFNFTAFLQLFPEFEERISAPQAQAYFNLATQFHANDGSGPVEDAATQTNLLNMLTAHVAQLLGPAASGGSTPGRDANVVGRMTNASEGSVSTAFEMPSTGSNAVAAWMNQTQYGAMYWTATAPFRTFRFRRGPVRPINPWPFTGRSPGWF